MMPIETSNRLIAEFMDVAWLGLHPVTVEKLMIDSGHYFEDCFYYHNNWDYLMPVVEKIEKLYEDDDTLPRFEINSHHARFTIGFEDWADFIAGCYLSSPEEVKFATKIEAVYYVVLQFIIANTAKTRAEYYMSLKKSRAQDNTDIGQSTII